jgi:UDPglucose 6-dehydrogenase
MKVTIYGSGYVGLVTGACLAEVGHQVICMDVDRDKIDKLKQGFIPIYEPGLDLLVRENHASGQLQFTTGIEEAVAHGDVHFIAVGTPSDEDGSADLRYVKAVAENIATHMEDFKVVVTKSTVPIGTADIVRDTIRARLQQRGKVLPFSVASNPEFLKEGSAISDFRKPDRIIVGTDSQEVKELMRELYAPFNTTQNRLLFMDIRSAEMTKYAANAMLATKLSFINEIANIAERVGADAENVRLGIGSDPRIGYQFIHPGCGYGGSCLPKDVKALYQTALSHGYQSSVLKAIEDVNQRQKLRLFEKISDHYCGQLAGKTFALWGLAFKPRTDDMREAPSRVLMEALWGAGAKVLAFDPEAMDETQRIYGEHPQLTLMGTKESVLRNADALIICTEWQHFLAPDFALLKTQLRDQVIFDGRNLYDPALVARKGIQYYAIGRGVVSARKEEDFSFETVALAAS